MQNTIKYEIPASEIADPEQLAAQIRETHQQFQDDPDERALALQGLLSHATARDGQPIDERVLDDITDPVNQSTGAAQRRSLLAGTASPEDSFQINVDGDSGAVSDVFFVQRLPLDKKATARAQQISDTTPSGPSTNGSSFRTGSVDPTKRR